MHTEFLYGSQGHSVWYSLWQFATTSNKLEKQYYQNIIQLGDLRS